MEKATQRPDAQDLLEHAEFVRGLARALVRDPWAADDLSQEAMAVALDLPPAHAGNLRAWFSRLLRNLLRTRRRSESRRAAREIRAGRRAPAPAAAETAASLEIQRKLVEAVQALDEPFRTAIVLRFFHGLSPSEIAARTRTSAKTVSSRLSRALAKLRDRLDADHGGRRAAWTAALAPLLASRISKAALIAGGAVVSGKLLAAGAAAAALLVALVVLVPEERKPEGARPEPNPVPAAAGEEPARDAPAPAIASAETSGSAPAGAGDEEPAWTLDVRVVDEKGAPFPNARLVFRNAAEKVLARAQADETGRAVLEAEEGGLLIASGRVPGLIGSALFEPEGVRPRRVSVEVVIRDTDPFGSPPWEVFSGPVGGSRLLTARGGHGNLKFNGGGADTMRGVDLALQWLCDHQLESGAWEGGTGTMARALLAFLAGGETHRHGKFKETIKRGLRALLEAQDEEGRFAHDREARALATLAVVEAWRLTLSTGLKPPAKRGLEAIGRESVAADPFVLLLEWHTLLVASELGLEVTPGPLDDRRYALRKLLDPETGVAAAEPAVALTGGAMFLTDLGARGAAPDRLGLDFLRERLTDDDPDGPLDLHYATLAGLRLDVGGEDWKAMNEAMKAALLDSRIEEGEDKGSWEPAGGLSRVETTAVNAATLEVYYRYWPPKR